MATIDMIEDKMTIHSLIIIIGTIIMLVKTMVLCFTTLIMPMLVPMQEGFIHIELIGTDLDKVLAYKINDYM